MITSIELLDLTWTVKNAETAIVAETAKKNVACFRTGKAASSEAKTSKEETK